MSDETYKYLDRILGAASTASMARREAEKILGGNKTLARATTLAQSMSGIGSAVDCMTAKPDSILQRITSMGAAAQTSTDILRSHRMFFEQNKAYNLGRLFTGLDRIAERVGFQHGWQNSFVSSIETASLVLGKDWLRPTGILADLGSSKLSASLSWIHDESMNTAALIAHEPAEVIALPDFDLSEQPEPAPISIEANVKCAFCGESMLIASHNLHWHGPREGVLQIDVFPACTECRQRASEDPEYFERALKGVMQPKLRIIEGDGEGDGESSGLLRLVCSVDAAPDDE